MSKWVKPRVAAELQRHGREFQRYLRNGAFERAGTRLHFPKAKLFVGGVFDFEFRLNPLVAKAMEIGDPKRVAFARKVAKALGKAGRIPGPLVLADAESNRIPNEGLDQVLDVWLSAGTQVALHYVGLFESNSTPAAGWTGTWADPTNGVATEFVDFDEAPGRPLWAENGVSGQSITNPTKAQFTCNNAATKTIYGATLNSTATLQCASGCGVLVAATLRQTPKQVDATDVINVGYTISATST